MTTYDRSSTREKWTIMKYMRDFELMTTYAYALRSSNELTKENIHDILDKMERDDIYHPREGKKSIDTGNFKIIQIAWYMFGYYDNKGRSASQKRFVFSPLGNLLLDNLKDKSRTNKIFLTMLFANGFRQPFSKMDHRFNIYPFRVIFQLLRDPRLGGILYNDEVFYFTMFLKTVTHCTYENLVVDILKFREIDGRIKYAQFKKNESVLAQALHEWTYASGLLESAGILIVKNDDNNEPIGVLCHGNGTGRRTYKQDYVVANGAVGPFMDLLLEHYPFYAKPFNPEELEASFDSDLVVKMYNFYPPELLVELGIDDSEERGITSMLTIATKIKDYAHNEARDDSKRFEFALRDAFNLFKDVVAERMSGPGNVDVECKYSPPDKPVFKFDIEGKSRRVKLMEVSAGRLKSHRIKIRSNYTIIVTPEFAPAVLEDITGDQTVIIKSATLSNFLYQYITRAGRDISYGPLDDIIVSNLGKDVTRQVSEYVYANFGHVVNSLTMAKA